MKYVGLLRGINVGGNSLVKMSDLKDIFESLGFQNVITYINSGNVIFECNDSGVNLIGVIEKELINRLKLSIPVVIRSKSEMKTILEQVPEEWKNKNNLRCYVGFVRENIKPSEVLAEVILKDGVDNISTGRYVVYMTTKLEGITKSGFTKLAGKRIYKEITIRNYNTVKKIFDLM